MPSAVREMRWDGFSSRQIARTLRPSFSGVMHVRFRHVWSGNARARDSVKVTVQLPRELCGTLLDAAPSTRTSARCLGVAAGRRTPVTALRHTEAACGGSGSVISLGPPLTFTTEPAVLSSGEPQNPFPPAGFVIVLARCLPRRPDRLSWALSAWCRGRSPSTMSRFRGSITQLPPR
jgi:hypothetical protein